jgi:hypothetical protein
MPEETRRQSSGGAKISLISHPKLMRRQGMVCKSWKGPLPLARSTQTWSPGDLQALDRRA